jgi:glycerol-3-phosphate dehydrogenase
MNQVFDVTIIGAGAVGCATARELSRYRLNIAVLDRESDVGAGTSGRNSAVVHAGFNNKPGSLMARLCVAGNLGFEALCKELDVPYKKTGKLVVAFDDEDIEGIRRLMENGRSNGVPGLTFLSGEEARKLAPKVGGIAAMHSAETAIISPFIYSVALAENAAANGVRFFFNAEVRGISRKDGVFRVSAGGRAFLSRYLVNSAGLYADGVAALAGDAGYKIYPCRGQYYILDKRAGEFLNIPVYPVPRAGTGGLGVHLTPTVEGNIIIGPSAEYIPVKCDCGTTAAVMKQLFREARQLLPPIAPRHIIGSYAGIRAKLVGPSSGGFGDFVIRQSEKVPGLINLIGIESPGLTASMPIARMVAGILGGIAELTPNERFIGNRRGILPFRELSSAEKAELVRQCPDYGEIVCQCEGITKKEILEAIENPLGVRTLAGIKYRARATMGRCQGGYCLARIADILIREYGMRPEEVTLRGQASGLFAGRVK